MISRCFTSCDCLPCDIMKQHCHRSVLTCQTLPFWAGTRLPPRCWWPDTPGSWCQTHSWRFLQRRRQMSEMSLSSEAGWSAGSTTLQLSWGFCHIFKLYLSWTLKTVNTTKERLEQPEELHTFKENKLKSAQLHVQSEFTWWHTGPLTSW